MLVCDKSLSTSVSISHLLYCDESVFPWGGVFMTIEFLLGNLSLGRLGSLEKASSSFAGLQVPTTQNNQSTKAAYFGVT